MSLGNIKGVKNKQNTFTKNRFSNWEIPTEKLAVHQKLKHH